MGPTLSPPDKTFGKLGEEITYQGRKWRIVADDSHTLPSLYKRWDYCIKDVENGEWKQVWTKDLELP